MKSFSFSGGALFLAVFCWATFAQATTVINVPLDQMTRESTVIVHARVEAQQVVQEAGTDRILTLTAIELLSPIKGVSKGETLTIYQVGGTLDGRTMNIIGALKFKEGEEFILFGVKFRDMVVSYGMGLGKYAVSKVGGIKSVVPQFGDVERVEPDGKGGYKPAVIGATKPEPLDSFIARVKSLAATQGGAK